MKAYIPNYSDCMYPNEMKKILNYLNANGKLMVDERKLETLYEYYSEDRWCAGWMCVNDDILEDFAGWLSEVEVG